MSRAALIVLLIATLGGGATESAAQQVDSVRVGSRAFQGARLQIGTSSMESFKRADGVDTRISKTTQAIGSGRWGGEEVYVIETRHESGGDTTRSSIVVRAADFSLLHHRVKAASDSAAVTTNAGALTGWVAVPGEPVLLLDQHLERPVFPIEGQIPWLFPLLPLEEGYAAAIPHFSEWMGGEEWTTIRVVGSEPVEQDGRTIDCWKVDGGELFPGYRVTYWVDKSSRRVVQGVARGREGAPEYWSRIRAP